MKKALILVGILLVIAMGVGGYFYWKSQEVPPTSALNAIPQDAALILNFDDFRSSWTKLKNDAAYYDDLGQTQLFHDIFSDVSLLDSLIGNNQNAKDY